MSSMVQNAITRMPESITNRINQVVCQLEKYVGRVEERGCDLPTVKTVGFLLH